MWVDREKSWTHTWHTLSLGRVFTYFDRVATVGMQRDYSWSFVALQAVCVCSEYRSNLATDPNRKQLN